MEWNSIIYPLAGGALIGAAVTLMLLLNGRVTGISGIVSQALGKPSKNGLWRLFFLLGLLIGGWFMNLRNPELFMNVTERSSLLIILAGLFVGYGTVMGSGCTSGHGVCGISRFSVRSLVATATFMFFGFLSIQILKLLLG